MGNCCGKASSEGAAFTGPGRTLGSAPPANNNARATIPAAAAKTSANANTNTPGRTIGGSVAGGAGAEAPVDNAKSAAAAAAEARAKKTAAPGSLAANLNKQKAKTMNATLDEASWEARRQREIEETGKTQNYN